MTFIVKSVAGLTLILALASCASVSVQKDTEHATPQMPQKVYAALFDTAQGKFKVDRDGIELNDFKRHLQGMMQIGLVTDLTHRLILAVPSNTTHGFQPENAWLTGKASSSSQTKSSKPNPTPWPSTPTFASG
jgi:hypothetical protein